MAITRRQFVTRLGALAGAVGFSQAEVSKLAEAFAGNSNAVYGGDEREAEGHLDSRCRVHRLFDLAARHP